MTWLEKYLDIPYKGISIRNLLTHTSGLPDYQVIMDKFWDKSKVAGNPEILEYLEIYINQIFFSLQEINIDTAIQVMFYWEVLLKKLQEVILLNYQKNGFLILLKWKIHLIRTLRGKKELKISLLDIKKIH